MLRTGHSEWDNYISPSPPLGKEALRKRNTRNKEEEEDKAGRGCAVRCWLLNTGSWVAQLSELGHLHSITPGKFLHIQERAVKTTLINEEILAVDACWGKERVTFLLRGAVTG